MTSKTITMARDNIERLIDRLSKAQMFKEVTELRAALADPVPPAGGDVKVLGYSVKGNRYAIRLTKGELLELSENYTGTVLIELVDRAHVTRLQAEVKRLDLEVSAYDYAHDALSRERDALKAELRKTNLTNQDFVSQIGDLQSELTKARELLTERDALLNDFCAHSALICGDLLRLAREDDCATTDPIIVRAYSAMDHSRKVKKILSAPADNGRGETPNDDKSHPRFIAGYTAGLYDHKLSQGEPVAWAMKPGLDRISVNPKASHAVFGHSGEPGWDVPLYAEPPAPVAAVMPDRMEIPSEHAPAYVYRKGWNACLDEFDRLNSEPKP